VSAGASSGAENPVVMLVTVIVGVSLTSAVLAWTMWRTWKSAERAETDLRHRRWIFLRLGLLYVGAAVFGVVEVLSGREPKESLIGLPVAALLAWFLLKAAVKVRVPPA
jgi:hypothetical protein